MTTTHMLQEAPKLSRARTYRVTAANLHRHRHARLIAGRPLHYTGHMRLQDAYGGQEWHALMVMADDAAQYARGIVATLSTWIPTHALYLVTPTDDPGAEEEAVRQAMAWDLEGGAQ